MAAETAPPPLEDNPVLVGEGVTVFVDEGDPDGVDEGVPELVLRRLEEVGG